MKAENQLNVAEYTLTDDDLAARWGFKKTVLQVNRTRGKNPPYLKIFGKCRYRLADVEAFERAALRNKNAA